MLRGGRTARSADQTRPRTALTRYYSRRGSCRDRRTRQSPPTGMRHLILGSASALPGGVAAKCPQEVDLAERGPVGVAEVELGVHGLPEQEVGYALLAAGPDDQVGVGLPGRVQVPGDVV